MAPVWVPEKAARDHYTLWEKMKKTGDKSTLENERNNRIWLFWWLIAFVTRSESIVGFIGHDGTERLIKDSLSYQWIMRRPN